MPAQTDRNVLTLNGDAFEALRDQYVEVVRKCDDLQEVLRRAAPNLRNYQFDGGGTAFNADRDALMARIDEVQNIREWAEQSAVRLYDQKEGA